MYGPPRTAWAVLRDAPLLRSFVGAVTISKLGNAAVHFAIPLIILERTGSAASLALGLVAGFAPHFLFGPWLGALADRVDRRRLLIASDLAQIVLALAAAAYLGLWPGDRDVWPLYLLAFAITTVDVAYWIVAEFCVVPALVDAGALAAANSVYFAAGAVAEILGPIVGGLLMAHGHRATIFLLDASSFVATLGLWLTLRAQQFETVGSRLRAPSTLVQMARSLRALASHHVLLPMFIALCLSQIGASTRHPLLVYEWSHVEALSQDQVGRRVSLLALVGIAGNLASPWLVRWAREGVLLMVHWLGAIVLGLLIGLGPPTEALLWAAVVCMEFLGSAVWVYTYHARQVFIPGVHLAAINAIVRAMLIASCSLGSVIYLPLGEAIGVRAAIALHGVPLALAIAVWLSHRGLYGLRLADAR